MANGLNKVMLLGNLGADPELRVTPGGQAILKMRLATTETYLDKSNTRQERTEWHSITLWGKRGEALGKFLKKGDRIFIEGAIRTSTYEKNGEKRYRTEIVASNVILNGKGKQDGEREERGAPAESGRSYGGGTRAPATAPAQRDLGGQVDDGGDDYGSFDGGDDEIPFICATDTEPRHLRRRRRWLRW